MEKQQSLLLGSFKGRPAHRVSWEILNGPIPAGFVIDHLCENFRCVNIHHLEPVTPAENSKRGRYGHDPSPLQIEIMAMKERQKLEWVKLRKKWGDAVVKKAMQGQVSAPSV